MGGIGKRSSDEERGHGAHGERTGEQDFAKAE